MPRVTLLKPAFPGTERRDIACPRCGAAGGKVFCRRCHGPRRVVKGGAR